MKQTIMKITGGCICALLAACSVTPGTGSLTVTTTGTASMPTSEIKSYDLSLSGPSNLVRNTTISDSNSYTFERLESGLWGIAVDGLNTTGDLLCKANLISSITANQLTQVSLPMRRWPQKLYTTLDSATAITAPLSGPAGTASGGTYVAGRYENGLSFGYVDNYKVTYPGSVISPTGGCIEFWAKLNGIDGTSTIPIAYAPAFLYINVPGPPLCMWYFAFTGNDGNGGAGLCAYAGDGSTCTVVYQFPVVVTYNQILGDSTIWHHYALTWSNNGVPGTSENIQIYLDGIPHGGPLKTPKDHNPTIFNDPSSATLQLFRYFGGGNNPAATITVDNLKIWNYAKTDFSDRLTE